MTQIQPSKSVTDAEVKAIRTPLDPFIESLAQRIGRKRPKEYERFLKFAVVGTLGAIIDFGTLNLLLATVLPPVSDIGEPLHLNVAMATTIAFVAAVCSNFFWNRYWTYPDSRTRSVRRQLTQFGIVSLIGWGSRTLWIRVTYLGFGALAVSVIGLFIADFSPDADMTAKIGANIAQFIGVFVVLIWNFFANRYWTFNDVE